MSVDQNPIADLVRQLAACDAASGLALLEAAVNRNPRNPQVLLLLAAHYMQLKDADRAEATYIAALNMAPDLAIARFQLGLLQLTSSRPATAFITWAPLDLLEQMHPLRLFKKAFERLQEDQIPAACEYLREGMRQNTDNAPLNRDMQMLLGKLGASVKEGAVVDSPEPEKSVSPESEVGAHFLLSTYNTVH
ncbi:tetratricopeptide repeat protein [Ralstonia sp. 1138]|uniref:tetratricopeptide repeat protein n=1 Tax=Ralstonia sp. 1138 TaxID=3156423 RepID=UPI003396533E